MSIIISILNYYKGLKEFNKLCDDIINGGIINE